jgi:hypothetical protein
VTDPLRFHCRHLRRYLSHLSNGYKRAHYGHRSEPGLAYPTPVHINVHTNKVRAELAERARLESREAAAKIVMPRHTFFDRPHDLPRFNAESSPFTPPNGSEIQARRVHCPSGTAPALWTLMWGVMTPFNSTATVDGGRQVT